MNMHLFRQIISSFFLIIPLAFAPFANAKFGDTFETAIEGGTYKIVKFAKGSENGLLIFTECKDCAQVSLKYNSSLTIVKGIKEYHDLSLVNKNEGKDVGIVYNPDTMTATQLLLR